MGETGVNINVAKAWWQGRYATLFIFRAPECYDFSVAAQQYCVLGPSCDCSVAYGCSEDEQC